MFYLKRKHYNGYMDIEYKYHSIWLAHRIGLLLDKIYVINALQSDFNFCIKNNPISLGVSTVKTNPDRDFLICRDQLLKSVKIILSVEKSIKIQKVSISLNKSWSRSRSTDLYIAVETKSRNLDQDWDISIVKNNFLKVSRIS